MLARRFQILCLRGVLRRELVCIRIAGAAGAVGVWDVTAM